MKQYMKKSNYLSKHCEVVLRSTPTKLTHSETTLSKTFFIFFSGISCWYIPIPRCFGPIFTNSDNGSCILRANDTKIYLTIENKK